MNTRLVRHKTRGQSIPLIALMIVVLFAMVGLAVDVGNTYAEQRNTVRSANAAALAGMNTVIRGGDDTSVRQVIVNSLASNNIKVAAPGAQPQPGERVLTANYLDSSGNPLASCPTVGSNCSASALKGATYLRVNVNGTVDTFFARVVGRPTLPVGADAFAKKAACTSGIYPITIRSDFLKDGGFITPPAVPYSDDTYRGKTKMRVTMHDSTNPSGGFNWTRWKGDKNAGDTPELIAMLSGDGNVDEGVSEVTPWPVPSTTLAEPPGYPPNPGQLDVFDWIHNNTGVSNASDVRAALDWHIHNRTEMILPIHDLANGDGNDASASYHVSGLGAFLLLDYDLSGQGWFDFVYIGKAGDCSTLTTTVPHTTNLGITGQVVFRPRNQQVPQSRPPIQYEIVLDVSGSMTWKFDGYGWRNNGPILCTGANSDCNETDAWPDQTLRRIYIAKQALKSFIDNMQPQDSMRIIAFSDKLNGQYSNQRAIDNLTQTLPSSGWSSDKPTLKQAVLDAGAQGSDPYKTKGRTPSATGLAAASQRLASAPTQAPDGQTYKRVVIFMTDGVANVFRDGSVPTYPSGCGSEIASPCNTGYTNSSPPVAMPITAMGVAADSLKQLATIYVIALAGVDQTGLTTVASASSYPFYSEAPNGSELAGILANIANNVQFGTCVPAGGNTWKGDMIEGDVGDIPGTPLNYPIVGYVYLHTQTGGSLPSGQGQAPIQVNADSGKLVYHFDNLTPGTYQMSAFVGYKGPDGVSRLYSLIYNPNTAVAATTMTFQLGPANTLGTVVPMDLLYLDMSGSVCAAP